MPGLVVAIVLGFSLLLVHYTLRSQPMPTTRPLDVDENLPLPWLAQTSAVFSLTGLFGGYFGVAVALGLPAIGGLAVGTVLGLFLVRHWITSTLATKPNPRFEDFLFRVLDGHHSNRIVYVLTIVLCQCLFATSELLIFRELARVALSLKSEQATLLTVCVGIIGYYYILHGGYLALFRTDVVQLLLVAIMTIAASAFLVINHANVAWTSALLPRPGYWEFPLLGSGRPVYFYHFVIAMITGLGLLLSSPDTWKRVYQVNRMDQKPLTRVLTFLGVGVLPYLVLLPVALMLSLNVDRQVKRSFTLPPALSDNHVFIAAALGLIASFLSAFNGAMLASVHLGMMLYRRINPVPSEALRFYSFMMIVLVIICALFAGGVALFSNPAVIDFTNPWVLGNMLIGGPAAVTGVQIGTAGNISRLPKYALQWILGLGIIIWIVYFLQSPGYSKTPTIESVKTVPVAVGVCLLTAILSRIVILGGQKRA